jgi:hypothetical protein
MSDARWNDPREDDVRDRGDEWQRVYDPRDRDDDPRDALMRDLDLPRGDERELVVDRDRVYDLDGEDSRTLAAVGAFRVVPERDLDLPHDTLDNLHDQRLVELVDLGDSERGLTLTTEGRDLLDSHSLERDREPSQIFYAGVSRSREIDHDSNLYATLRLEEARLRDEHPDLEIRRIVLEQDLKREYQEFLQDHNRARSDSDGRPGRDENEVRDWAREHDLPYFDDQVHFPDYRIEYEVDGRELHQDVASARNGGIPVTHEYPPNRAFDSVSISRVSALRDYGLTPRQREFLVTVMVHSGCFLERQYCEFTSTVRGQNSREFMARLVARGFVRGIEPGPVRRGRLYHVHHKPLYEAIGQADNRNRRLCTIGRMVERVMILDAVLGDRRRWWLSPESDKRAFFDVTQQTGLRPEDYPHIAFGAAPRKTNRCFPDKLPIGIEKDDTSRFVFLYLVNRRVPVDFRQFLIRHVDLFRCLHHWTIRLLVPRRFRKAVALYKAAVREQLWTPLNPNVSKSLEMYFRQRQEQGGHLGDPSDRYIAQEFRKQGMPKILAVFRAWRRTGDKVVRHEKFDIERFQGRLIKGQRTFDIADSQNNVVEHRSLPPWRGRRSRLPFLSIQTM